MVRDDIDCENCVFLDLVAGGGQGVYLVDIDIVRGCGSRWEQ